MDIARLRLYNQHIASPAFEKPGDVVKRLGAVQAQDYLGALWAIGLRLRNASEREVEGALAERTILRTWPMRGTLHFVAAADACWMLELLAPRVAAGSTRRLQRQFDLDEAVFARCRDAFERALGGGRQLSRNGMYRALEAAGIPASGGRGLQIVWRLAQEGLICFGARQGKQQTFVLLAEWAPQAKSMARDEALAELARRYFTSHGPATLADFSWWSGLTTAEAQAGLEMARPHLVSEAVEGQTYWLSPAAPAGEPATPSAHLLPAFDEYTVAYKDRSAALAPADAKRVNAGFGILNPAMVVDGQVVGAWKRRLKKESALVTPSPFRPLKEAEREAIESAARRYGAFLGLEVEVGEWGY